MSALAAALKSPTPAICQALLTIPSEPCELMVVPFINHRYAWPELLRHRISALPSPLKSPTPAICQALLTIPSEPCELMVVPFINHRYAWPELLRHRISALPAPLKSRQRRRAGVGRTYAAKMAE